LLNEKIIIESNNSQENNVGINLAVVIGLVITISALADYGHPIVAYNPNPYRSHFPEPEKLFYGMSLHQALRGIFRVITLSAMAAG